MFRFRTISSFRVLSARIRNGMCALGLLAGIALQSLLIAAEPEARPPEMVIRELLAVYGKNPGNCTYIPSLAVLGRLRFGSLTHAPEFLKQVEQGIPADIPPAKSNGDFAGRLLFAELARVSSGELKTRSLTAVRDAADRLFQNNSRFVIRLPPAHEMSDAAFMCGPILCEAGSLDDDAACFQGAVDYLRGIRMLRLRNDGLYRHGHLCDTAWGRGNGFPAVGVAWCLSLLPEDHAGRGELQTAFRDHMAALLKHQDANGMWHQVIDEPSSYAEFSCTAMIGFAMQRGVTRKFLDEEIYQPAVDRAWTAICQRIEPGGRLIDVCEGTGTQKSLAAYLERKAIRGVDDRGGAMALLLATERLARTVK